MKHLTRSIIALLGSLTILYNIERLDFGAKNVVDIQSFVYVLAIIAATSIVVVPTLRRAPLSISFGLWISLYFLLKLVFFHARPLIGGVYTYLSITEVALLSLVIRLAHELGYSLQDFEDAVRNLTFTDFSHRIQRLDEAAEEIQSEMFRSRHNHRPLSVIVVEPRPGAIQAVLHRAAYEIQQALMRRYVVNKLANLLSSQLRRTDLVLEQRGEGRFVIVCPETNASDATMLSEYIETIVAEKIGVSVLCGRASFPEGALTFEELVRQAESNIKRPVERSQPLIAASTNSAKESALL